MEREPRKRCDTCRELKSSDQFLPSRYLPGGATANCKSCILINARRDREQREQRNANRARAAR